MRALRSGVDVVIACPGRLEDLIQQGECRLSAVEITVLDEADHMADLGFLPAVRRLLTLTPSDGQRLLFSATLDAAVDGLVKRFLARPATHQADSVQNPVAEMEHHVLHVPLAQRASVLADLASAPGRTCSSPGRKHRAETLARQLNAQGIPAVELHGNLNQNARTRNLKLFQTGQVETLVATDIAARGMHVDDIELVVHADPPVEHKAYLHRSGRTARAGKSGTVITLMTDDQVREVRTLTRAAGVRPTTTRVETVADPILVRLAPGRRVLLAAGAPRSTVAMPARTTSAQTSRRRGRASGPAPERPNAGPERSRAPRRNRVAAPVRATARPSSVRALGGPEPASAPCRSPVVCMDQPSTLARSEMLVTNPDYENDRTESAIPGDPDPAVPGVEAENMPGVPAGSARPSGESDFVDGAEVPADDADADTEAMETPIVPSGAAGLGDDEATTED